MNGTRGNREIVAHGGGNDINAARGIGGDLSFVTPSTILTGPTYIGGPDQRATGDVHFGDHEILRERSPTVCVVESADRARIIGGSRGAEHAEIACSIHHHAIGQIAAIATEIGGPDECATSGIQLAHGDVRTAVGKRCLECTGGHRITLAEAPSPGVDVPLSVIGGAVPEVACQAQIARTAQGRSNEHRIDHHGTQGIRIRKTEAYHGILQREETLHPLMRSVSIPGHRRHLHKLANAGAYHQASIGRDLKRFRSFVSQLHLPHARTRIEQDIVFEGRLLGVQAYVHAGPNIRIVYLTVYAHMVRPVAGLVPKEVVQVRGALVGG